MLKTNQNCHFYCAHLRKQNNKLFLEYNHKILYFICLRSRGKNFMKFDRIDWKILAFKVGKKSLFEHWHTISDDFDHHLWNFFVLWIFNLKKIILKN